MMLSMFMYKASQGIVDCTNEPTRDAMVQMAMARFLERKVELTEESIFCCRMLVGEQPGDMGDPKLATFILRKGDDGEPDVTLMLWTEAEERGIAKYLLSLINQGDGSYRPEIGRRMYPHKTPEGTPPDEIH